MTHLMRLSVFLLASALFALPSPAYSQKYPSRTVTIISPGTPAGGMDFVLRPFLPELAKRWGQAPVVENRPGAAAMIGPQYLSRAKPDGYTLMIHSVDALVYQYFRKDAPDGEKLFLPLAIIANQSKTCVVHPSVGIKSMPEFIAYTKSNPGKLNLASFTSLTITELMVRRLVQMTGIQVNQIASYSTGPSQFQAMLANETQFACLSPTGIAEQVKAGKLFALAVTGRERLPSLPEVPTLRSLGHNFVWEQWYAIFALTGTPKDIVEQLRRDFGEVMKNPDVMAQVSKGGFEPETRTPEQTVTVMADDLKLYKELIKAAGIEPQ